MLTVATDPESTPAGPASSVSLIDEIVRDGARRMLAAALEAEVAAYIGAHAEERDELGRRLVVRNGHAVPRQVLTSAGAVEVRAPRVNDKRFDEVTGERRGFSLAILPAWCRKSPKITEAPHPSWSPIVFRSAAVGAGVVDSAWGRARCRAARKTP